MHAAARLQQQANICQVAEIEDQLHEQMKTQCMNFQNPKSAVNRPSKSQPTLKTTSNDAISSMQTLQHTPGHEDNGEAQEVETAKGSETGSESIHGEDDYHTNPDVAAEGSEDEKTMGIHRKPAKITCHLIEAAHTTTKAKLGAKAAPSQPSVIAATGKCKLKCDAAVIFALGPPQKKKKCNHPSGLSCSHKEGKTVDSAQHECHIESQTGEHITYRGNQKPAGAQDTMMLTHFKGPLAVTKIIANTPQQCLQHSAPIANATATKNQPSHQNLPKGSAAQFMKLLDIGESLDGIWDKVMLDWPHWFDEDDHVYCLCMQKTYEWHAHISKAGIEAVEVLWASDLKYKNPEEQKAYVDFVLSLSLPFMYGSVEHLGGNKYSTFVSHIRDISVVNNKTYHESIDYEMPRGALVLAVTSVEQALTLYSTGAKEVPTKQSKASFSDIGWGTKTSFGAKEYCSAAIHSRQAQVPYSVSVAGKGNMIDDQALITVSSDIKAELDIEGKHFKCSGLDVLISNHWTLDSVRR
ncbi:hypothetical protein F5J12DRAFT_785033 [Pisolithus orientalis]|uniref:uncharacterized protein n=1 Tax=Pisolithus orientalis TaxID=936130 RepID=UPI002224D6AB|nr:uncharacterized protein F5J12DRAFT_785033 [Pisolithus orientalis]KAI5997807.1 hypothetical protein F5J12DRAFT_785033 [Pisolithus orientalis]